MEHADARSLLSLNRLITIFTHQLHGDTGHDIGCGRQASAWRHARWIDAPILP
jgi:hypothetical protein